MSRLRIYIKPFDASGVYAEFIEVTDYVLAPSISTIKREIDATEYDLGVFKNSSISIELANETGRFSTVDVAQSIFNYKRGNSIVKVTWNPDINEQAIAGSSYTVGDYIVYTGLINDDSTTLDLVTHKVKFNCLGFESQLEKMEAPFDDFTIGDTPEEILLSCLNQAPFNTLVTVDALNISCGTNGVVDAIAHYENNTVREVIDELLLVSNSVLYIEDDIVYVVDRTESASLKHTFYGQASNIGIENVQKLSNIREGLNRVFNLITWQDSTEVAREATSILKHGASKKEFESEAYTDTTKRATILTAIKDEFGLPKMELELTTPVKSDRLELKILDKVNIDYPTVFIPADENQLPLWGKVKWGEFRWPIGAWSLTLTTDIYWKIIGITYDLKKDLITYKLREI